MFLNISCFLFILCTINLFFYKCTALTIINPNGPVSFRCLDCICDTVSDCNEEEVCIEGDACGMYRITPSFWADAGKPTIEGETHDMEDAFVNCAINKKCARLTVQQYMDRNKRDCNGDGAIDCKDFFAMHILGANCNRTIHENFLKRYDQCELPNKRVKVTKENNNIYLPNYDYTCEKCLCEAATGCNKTIGCEEGFCGMYKLTRKFWEEAGRPVILGDDPDRRTAYEECALNENCAERTIKLYLKKYGKDCNGDAVTTCTDYMMISFNGGEECNRPVSRNNFGVEVMSRFFSCLASRTAASEILDDL